VTEGDPSLRLAFDVGGSFVKAGLAHIESGLWSVIALRGATRRGGTVEAGDGGVGVDLAVLGAYKLPDRLLLVLDTHRVRSVERTTAAIA